MSWADIITGALVTSFLLVTAVFGGWLLARNWRTL